MTKITSVMVSSGTTTASWATGHGPSHSDNVGASSHPATIVTAYAPNPTKHAAGINHGWRTTSGSRRGNTNARWSAPGHSSMYSGPVKSANSRNGRPTTTSLTVVPRNHGTLLPAAPAAMNTSGTAAGSSGFRQKTNAP